MCTSSSVLLHFRCFVANSDSIFCDLHCLVDKSILSQLLRFYMERSEQKMTNIRFECSLPSPGTALISFPFLFCPKQLLQKDCSKTTFLATHIVQTWRGQIFSTDAKMDACVTLCCHLHHDHMNQAGLWSAGPRSK